MRKFKISLSTLSSLAFAGAFLFPANALADDIPLPPSNFRANDGVDRYTFSWSQVSRTGVNGESVDPSKVTYVLESLNGNYETERQLSSSNSRNYTFFYPTTRGEQDIMRFGLYARNSAGKSSYNYLKVVTGAPYNLPYRESFANAATRGLCWQDGDGIFAVTSQESADEDGGCLACIPASDGTASSFNLGKIMLSYSKNPRITFRIYGLGEVESLRINVVRPDGQEASLKTITGPIDEWTRYTVDLSSIKNQTYIIPKFVLAEGNVEYFYLDDIAVEDPYDDDLAVLVRPLDTRETGASVRVKVENVGMNPSSGASVAVYTDGKFTTRIPIEGEIKPEESRSLDVNISVKAGEPVEVKACIEWAYDLNPYNDVATTQLLAEEGGMQATGIDEVTESANQELQVYSIDGRKIEVSSTTDLAPGVYIINGKKTFIK